MPSIMQPSEEGVGVVVDHRVAVAVELGGQDLLRQRHAHRIGDALAERAVVVSTPAV